MKALIQRVSSAKVEVENKTVSSINHGLLIFIGIYFNDTLNDIDKLYNKVINMRVFEDKNKFSVSDVKGERPTNSFPLLFNFTVFPTTCETFNLNFISSK